MAEEDGGAGLDATAAVLVHEALSTSDPGFALAYLAHSVLFVNNFYRNASPAQRRRFLPGTLSGERIGGMCMTEPEAGTDVLGMRTTARRHGDSYMLDGRKTFITNGGHNAPSGRSPSYDEFAIAPKTKPKPKHKSCPSTEESICEGGTPTSGSKICYAQLDDCAGYPMVVRPSPGSFFTIGCGADADCNGSGCECDFGWTAAEFASVFPSCTVNQLSGCSTYPSFQGMPACCCPVAHAEYCAPSPP